MSGTKLRTDGMGSAIRRASVTASVSALKSGRPGEHLPEDDAHREEVGAAIDLARARLLGRHVRELALDLLRPRDRRGARRRARRRSR